MTEINGAEIEPVDVITFGSPCQDLSVAGKRAGLKHSANGDDETTRSGLFMEAVRIIKEMRKATNEKYPRFAVWENVPGAFSSNKGEDFRIVLQELIKIAEPQTAEVPPPGKAGWPYADIYMGDGWSLAYRVFDAQHWGVPQRRRRIYLVIDLGGQAAGKVLFERPGLRGHFEEGRTPWQGAAGDAQNRTGINYPESGVNSKTLIIDNIGGQTEAATKSHVNGTLRAGARGAVCYGISSYGSKGMMSDNPHSGIYEAETSRTLDLNGGNPACNQGGIAVVVPAITCTMGGFMQVNEEIAPTLLARDWKDPTCVSKEYIIRRLTPTECARLQGFPDRWGDIPQKDNLTDEEYSFWLDVRNTHATINGKATKEYTRAQMLTWYNKLHSDSAEYKMWGNGIALPNALYVMQGIAKEIEHGRNRYQCNDVPESLPPAADHAAV